MFYVNTDTKLFIAAPQSDSPQFHAHNCLCGDQNDKPLFLSTCQKGPASCKKVSKPVIYNYATNVLQFTFLDNEGLPYDLTDCTLALAVDNTFSHSDSLVALADGDVLSPLDAVVEFKVSKFSKKFAQLLKSGIPASQIWMQITAYNKNGEQNVLLQDRGIKLATKLLLNEGITQDNLLNFYNKQQIDAFLIGIGRPDLIPDKGLVIAGEDPYSDSKFYADDLYINLLTKDFYLKLSDSVMYLGSLDKSGYYTKVQVDQIASTLSNSIASVKSSLSNYYTIEQADQLLDTKASDSYVQQINQQVQDLKQLHIVKLNAPQQGFAATYQLQDHQGNPLGASINIFKDKFLNDVKLIVASQQDHEAAPSVIIGDPYLKFIFNTQPVTTVYVAVKSLVDVYNAGQGLKLQNNTFSIESDQQEDSVKFLQIGTSTIGLKGITTAVNKALSDAKTYTDTKLQGYYTKSQVNTIAGTLSNSITALKQELHGSYYTRTQVDEIVSNLSDSVDLSNYYTKGEVDALIAGLSDSTDLRNYYTKPQVDAIAAALSNSIAAVKGNFDNYYNKEQIDQLFQQFSDSVDLSNYYTKNQVNVIVQNLSNSLTAVKDSLQDYYTKSQTDAIASSLSNSIASVKSSLSNYYTSNQVNVIVQNLSDSINGKLQDYYTKSQMEGFLGSLSDSLAAVKSTFSQYYNKGEVDAFVSVLSDSLSSLSQQVLLQKNYNNIQNKPSIAGVTLQGDLDWDTLGIHQVLNTSQQFTGVGSDSCLTLYGSTLPVAVLTSKGNIYPIEKGSLEYSSQQNTMKLNVHPYLVYDDEETFSGTWKVYFAAGYREVSGDIIQLQNTSITPSHGVTFKRVLEASDSFTIDITGLPSSKQITFQLHLIQPSTAVAFTLPSSIIWTDGAGDFSYSNPPPVMSLTNTLYCIVLRWDGSSLQGSLSYTKEYTGA